MNILLILSKKEFTDGIRNRWVLAIILLLSLFALTLVFLGSASVGEIKANAIAIIIVSLASLNIFLIPLIALLLSYDTLVGEFENGTMPLLLSYPLLRWQVVIGKYIGQSMILVTAIIVSYALTALIIKLTQKDIFWSLSIWAPYILMSLTSILLGMAFLSIGYFISAISRERAHAAGISIGAWLLLVLIYDIALLSTLVVDKGRFVSETILSWLLWFNPADAYRLFNLNSEHSANIAGILNIGTSVAFSPSFLILSLIFWITIPLGLTIYHFRKKSP